MSAKIPRRVIGSTIPAGLLFHPGRDATCGMRILITTDVTKCFRLIFFCECANERPAAVPIDTHIVSVTLLNRNKRQQGKGIAVTRVIAL